MPPHPEPEPAGARGARGQVATRRFVLGAVLVYHLVLLHPLALGADLRVGLKPSPRAA